MSAKSPESSQNPGQGDGNPDLEAKRVETDCGNPESGSTVAVDPPPCDAPPSRGSSAEEPPDTSDMMAFMLDSPGGACGISLGLFSLGLLSVYVSIPKQIVLVDSTLVDNDAAKR